MEKFDINKEMAKLKGLNIIEKCSALDDLLDDLEDAQEQIICAKDEYEFYDPEYERSVMFPNGEDEKRMISPSKYRQVWKINLI